MAQLKLRRFKDTSDLTDLIIEKKLYHRLKDVDKPLFMKVLASGEYDGVEAVTAFESQNFGYIRLADGTILRC